jgi:hypothetical protein
MRHSVHSGLHRCKTLVVKDARRTKFTVEDHSGKAKYLHVEARPTALISVRRGIANVRFCYDALSFVLCLHSTQKAKYDTHNIYAIAMPLSERLV